jgi:dihydrofolate reductase/thymidylate synthase
MLAPFSIIVAVDSTGGIAKDYEIPWASKEDAKFFRETTIGKKKNVVIMGRTTYEAIPEDHRPLEGRKCVIISRTWKQDAHPEISVYPSLTDALAGVGSFINSYDEVFVAGGEQLYKEAVSDYLYLCKRIYVTKFKMDYSCNLFFPFDKVKDFPQANEPVKTRDYIRYTYLPKETHGEYQYLNLIKDIKDNGESKPDDTGIGMKMTFGSRLTFDIRDRIPLVTTRRLTTEDIAKEFIFMLEGCTDARRLEEQGVKTYVKYTNKKSIDEKGLGWDEGDTGPNNGWCFRHWGADYKGCDMVYDGQGIDQLRAVVDGLRKDPFGRRHMLTSWSPVYVEQRSVNQSVSFIQFNVSPDRKFLDCQLYQNSGDVMIDVARDIALYSLLTYCIAHVVQLRPRNITYVLGEVYMVNNAGSQASKLLGRTPRPFSKLSFREGTRIHELSDFNVNSFIFENYNSWPVVVLE